MSFRLARLPGCDRWKIGVAMFTAKQYRAKAAEYTELLKATSCLPKSANFGGSNEAASRWPKTKNGWQTIAKK